MHTITTSELLDILQSLSVLNRDNSFSFTNTERLDAIANLLRSSVYKRIKADGLFHIYSRKPVTEIEGPVIIVSSHVDCEYNITKCFTKIIDDETVLGTFDNAITNAAVVYLMLYEDLPDNVLIAFTGDEEEDGRGASDVIRLIKRHNLDVMNVFVLDVTEEGWKKGADFTFENDFWDEGFGKRAIELAEQTGYRWSYVPEDPGEIPEFIPKDCIIKKEAEEDETWKYEEDLPCFSYCLPTKGEMHSNDGVLARTISFIRYTEVLGRMLKGLSDPRGH